MSDDEQRDTDWRDEIGSDASMRLRAKLRLYADRVREDDGEAAATDDYAE